MATHAPITGAPMRAHPFKINGVSLLIDEPYTFLDQAHALACCLDEAAAETVSMNSDLIQAAARGVATLIHLAAIGLHTMDLQRGER